MVSFMGKCVPCIGFGRILQMLNFWHNFLGVTRHTFLAATKQLWEHLFSSVCLSVWPSVTPFWQCSCHRIILKFQELLPLTDTMSMQKIKVRGQRSRSQMSWPHLAVSRPQLQFEFTYGNEMMHKAWCCLKQVPYCSSRSSVKFQGHTAK